MMYLIDNYLLGGTGLDKYIILPPSELEKACEEHKKILDPIAGRLRLDAPGFYTFTTWDNINYYLDVNPTLYSYINALTTNAPISDGLYKVSIDIEKTLYSALKSVPKYGTGSAKLKAYLADIDNYSIDETLYGLYRNVLRYRAGEQDMENQAIIDAYNAMQQQLADLENSTTAEILTKLLEISDQVNNLSGYLSSLRPESNIYRLTSGFIESFNHLVDVCKINTQ